MGVHGGLIPGHGEGAGWRWLAGVLLPSGGLWGRVNDDRISRLAVCLAVLLVHV